MNQQPAPKKRKWDVPGDPLPVAQPPALAQVPMMPYAQHFQHFTLPTGVTINLGMFAQGGQIAPPQPIVLPEDAVRRAQEAAAAMLSIIPQDASKTSQSRQFGEISRELCINECPTDTRIHLTKRGVQEAIMSRTNTAIVTKGRYYPPGAPVEDKERPIYLKITPNSSIQAEDQRYQAVNNAAFEVERIIKGGPSADIPSRPQTQQSYNAFPPPAPLQGMGQPGTSSYPQQQQPMANQPPTLGAPIPLMVFVGISNPAPEFGLNEKIRGPDGAFLGHITSSSGASIQLRGRGSVTAEGPEPLYLHISGPSHKTIEEAKGLALDLLKTIKDEYVARYPHLAHTVVVTTIASVPQPTATHPPPAAQMPSNAYLPPPYPMPSIPSAPYNHPYSYPPSISAGPSGGPSYPMPVTGSTPGASYPPAGPSYRPPAPYYPPQQPFYQPPINHASHQQPYAHGGMYPHQQSMAHHQPPHQQPLVHHSYPPVPGGPVQVQQEQPVAAPNYQQGTGWEKSESSASSHQQAEPKRKFREFKETEEAQPAVGPLQEAASNPYAQYASNAAVSTQPSVSVAPQKEQTLGSMGPPPPKSQGTTMGPPPVRAPDQGSMGGGVVTGSLAGLVAYDDDE